MSDDYMTTRIDFLNATASYLGLPEDCLGMASSMHTEDNGCMVAVLHVHLSPRDMIGISKRMESMAQMSNGIVTTGEEEEAAPSWGPAPTTLEEEVKRTDKYQNAAFDGKLHPKIEEFRVAYNALIPAEKKLYGSRYNYVLAKAREEDEKAARPIPGGLEEAAQPVINALMGRQVVHIDTPEEAEPTNMESAWISTSEATDAQKQFCIESNFGGTMLHVQWAMLTDEQKQKAKP